MAPFSSLSALLLILASLCLAEVISLKTSHLSHNIRSGRSTDLSIRVHNPGKRHSKGYSFAAGPSEADDAELLDIVLVASVDGKFHALSRSSGEPLWSMSSSSSVTGAAPATLGPLIRTQHPRYDPDITDDESSDNEIYVIEPQSGEIYVMSTPDSPLQRLPFTMPQLVDMSPFSFSSDGDHRVFVGKRETSLLLVELETGRVKATLNAECPWDPFEDLSENKEYDDLDLDELEGDTPPRRTSKPTEVFIGRTDYRITIYSHRTPTHNLSFSTYGPNNQDHGLQSVYRRTADDRYIESLPTGKIISFRANMEDGTEDIPPDERFLWAHAFPNPIVAVFDVLKSPSRQHPFVLLQPRPKIEDILPSTDLIRAAKESRLPNIEAAFVGLVEETESLYAMSPDRYPLVIFGDSNANERDNGVGRSIDPPPDGAPWDFEDGGTGDGGADLPSDVDSISRKVKLRHLCRNGSKDIRCLTGIKRLESSSMSRLLDGAPTVPYPPYQNSNSQAPVGQDERGGASGEKGNSSIIPGRGGWMSGGNNTPGRGEQSQYEDVPGIGGMAYVGQAFSVFALVGVALLLAMVFMGFKKRNTPIAPNVEGKEEVIKQANGDTSVPAPVQDEVAPEDAPAVTPAEPVLSDDTPPIPPTEKKPPPPSLPIDDDPAPTPTPRTVAFQSLSPSDSPATTPTPVQTPDADDQGEESDGDATAAPGSAKKRSTRRRRGKKKKSGTAASGAQEDGGEKVVPDVEGQVASPGVSSKENSNSKDDGFVHVVSPSALVVPTPPNPAPVPSLIVSDNILGFGSHGTVVFKGSLQGRAVAVKRLLRDFVTLAEREITILQESDDHPNVIRYYYQEAQSNFLYIALELCPASLADIVEKPDQFRDIAVSFDPKRAVREVTKGLRHLHGLGIIHRDIKPQNILVSGAKPGGRGGGNSRGEGAGHRMLISDFGLCKKLDVDQTSFMPTVHGTMAAGTVGWRAPEILRGEVKIDEPGNGNDESYSSRGSVGSNGNGSGGAGGTKPARLTKAVDIFALGCLFYYVLTNGGHPFGDRFEREANIWKGVMWLDGLEGFGEEGSEAVDLISRMLSPEARGRPDTATCLLHPYFWDPGKRLTFLQDASDRFEIMCRDPRDPNLVELERGAVGVVGNDWNSRLDKFFIENLGKFRKYDGKSVQDLLRALRNKKHHYQDLPDSVKRQVGPMPEGFLSYFTRRFPRLFLHVHSVIDASSLRQESMFRTYFELSD